MKAIILVAGVGSRLRPLTDVTHKALLPIGDSTTLGLMVAKLHRHGINSFIIVCGNMEDKIRDYLGDNFPTLVFDYVTNDQYKTTNTGYSLLVAQPFVHGESFIKLDGDVNFDEAIVARLAALPDDASYVCVDKSDVDDEVIKVQCDESGHVVRIGNKLPVALAAGESIGIERISAASAPALFAAIRQQMAHPDNHQNYYEVAYDEIVQAGEPFKTLDITGLHWVEMDNHEDYQLALKYFGSAENTPV